MDRWEGLRARVARLVAGREARIEEVAEAWTEFLRRQGWSRGDVDLLWEGLTEELLRRLHRQPEVNCPGLRREVLAVMAAVRTRVLASLEGSEDREWRSGS